MANNDWLKALSDANSGKADPIPKGFYTQQELVKITGKSRATIQRTLPILLEQGKAVVGYYRRINRANALVLIPHYRLKANHQVQRTAREHGRKR